jgi:peptide/nickel transport system ATP-binding protein
MATTESDAVAVAEAPLLELDSVRTEYRSRGGVVHAVQGVSFRVARGEVVGIVGETGCGKSATLRSIIGLVRPPGRVVDGSVRLAGRELVGASRSTLRSVRGEQVGFVGQNPFACLNPILDVRAHFRNVAKAHGRKAAGADDFIAARLRGVGLRDPKRVMRAHAHELSGGMAQRVVIALAMSQDPSLLLADEPTTALDVTVQRQILDLIRGVVAEHRSAMLLATHDLGVVAHYCDSVMVMYAGKVVEAGPVRRVLQSPRHPYTRALRRAVPRPGEDAVGIPGTMPDLVDYPPGCPYHARCPIAVDRCVTEVPQQRPVKAGGVVACHLAEVDEFAAA